MPSIVSMSTLGRGRAVLEDGTEAGLSPRPTAPPALQQGFSTGGIAAGSSAGISSGTAALCMSGSTTGATGGASIVRTAAGGLTATGAAAGGAACSTG